MNLLINFFRIKKTDAFKYSKQFQYTEMINPEAIKICYFRFLKKINLNNTKN